MFLVVVPENTMEMAKVTIESEKPFLWKKYFFNHVANWLETTQVEFVGIPIAKKCTARCCATCEYGVCSQ